METWIIFALLSAVTGGLYNFSYKVIAQRNYDIYLSTIYSYAMATFLAGVYCLLNGSFILSKETIIMTTLLGVVNIVFFYTSVLTRVTSMKNIDTVIFFPLYKTFGPLLITGVSILFFQETLAHKDILGIVLGMTVPLLLITKAEHKIQKNLYLGVILVVATALLTSISSTASKMVHVKDLSPDFFLFISLLFGTLISFFAYHFHSKKSHKKYRTHGILKFSLSAGVIHVLAFFTFMYAIKGNLAIAFTINSFSILIPIILSIIFYGEHFNLKKGLVIALSIVSILLFI